MKNRKQKARPTYQTLEPRKMLAGDVTVALNGDLLTITGDADANQIVVAGLGDGSTTVIGNDGTTINGGAAPFSTSESIDNVVVRLGEGDDTATVQGLVLSKTLSINNGGGNDRTNVHHIDVRRFENIGGAGDDVMEFNNVYSRRSILISGENGNDTVSITAMAAGTHINLLTAAGNDTVAIDNIGIKNNLNINTGAGDDSVLMTGEVYGYRANLLLGDGNDDLSILPQISSETALFFRSLNLQAGSGNDSVVMDPAVTSRRLTTINGSAGTDAIQDGSAVLRDRSVTNFEATEVANASALLDAVYTSLQDLDIDTAPFGRANTIEPVAPAITAAAVALNQNENSGPQALDDQLSLVGDGTFTGATISLGDNFVADQDQLAFDDNDLADAITATFDSTTGQLLLTGDGTAAEYQTALQAVTFDNTSEAPDTTDRTATITVSRADGDELTATRAITVVGLNDAPAITGVPANVTVDLDNNPARPIALAADATITDADTEQLSGAVVAIVDGRVPGDVLAFTETTETTGIAGSFDPDTGALTFTGDANVAAYQTLLRSATFDQQGNSSGQRFITIQTTDAQGDDSLASDDVSLTVNLTTSRSATLASSAIVPFFNEASDPVNVDNQIAIDAGSNAVISEARVEIITGLDSSNDVLTFDRRFASANGITASGSNNSLSFTGNVAPEIYQSLLRSVTFHSNDVALSETQSRTVQYVVTTDTNFRTTKEVTLTPRSEAARSEPIDSRDDRLIQEYIAANNLTTQPTASGLHYIIDDPAGTGPLPAATDDIIANYTGTYLNGVKFDNGENTEFNLSRVISGWTEAFQLIPEGSTGQLLIPSRLGYGDRINGTIPANSVLVFDYEFLEIL